ncbi:MAG: invasion associated locus B family protein [Inquilinaceae bacterium]
MQTIFRAALSVLTLAFVLAGASTVAPVLAQEAEYLGSHRDWHAYQFTENGNRACYIVSKPTEERGDYTSRGDVYVMVTHRPAEGSRDVVSFISGYTHRPDSEVEITIGSENYSLFTSQDTAWARDATEDSRLVAAMRAGSDMISRGTSSRGTATTDTYSLRGFTAALEEINEACGL